MLMTSIFCTIYMLQVEAKEAHEIGKEKKEDEEEEEKEQCYILSNGK